MKSLSTLIKLQKTRVDEQRGILLKLQLKLEQIEKDIAELEIVKAREQVVADKNPEARSTYGAFLKAAVITGRELERGRQIAVASVEAARDILTQLFEEQKRYETAEAARVAAEAKEIRRRETLILDEVGGVIHERNKSD